MRDSCVSVKGEGIFLCRSTIVGNVSHYLTRRRFRVTLPSLGESITSYAWIANKKGAGGNNEASELSEPFLRFPRKNKPLHNGSYEHRVPKTKNQTLFCTRDVCVIQHRNWPLRSTIFNAPGTNASPGGLCTRTHTNEAFWCWFCCNSFRVDEPGAATCV